MSVHISAAQYTHCKLTNSHPNIKLADDSVTSTEPIIHILTKPIFYSKTLKFSRQYS